MLFSLTLAAVVVAGCSRSVPIVESVAAGATTAPANQSNPTAPLPPAGTVAALRFGQTLRIQYNLSGCFHQEARAIDIYRTADGGFVARAHNAPQSNGETVIVDVPLDTIRALDKELTEHRHAPSQGCTTSVSMDLVLSDRTGELSRERIVDDSCAVDGPLHSLGKPPP
jgi:hypothetical protein